MGIRTKITAMGLLLTFLSTGAVIGITLHQEKVLKRNISAEVEQLVRNETNRVALDVYLMCRAMQESLDQMLINGLKEANGLGVRNGRLDFNGPDSFTWKAINQFSGKRHQVVLPKVRYNDRWLGYNVDFTVPTPFVDKISDLHGLTCTVFQRMNEAGDMLRVATSVPTLHGKRAIGTYIPRHNPDGSPNPVIETLLRGEVFTGSSYVVNSSYQTRYQPLWNASGTRIVGALYVGKKQESITSLRRGILDIVIGKSGYVAILGARGKHRGKYLISKNAHRDGENVLEDKNPLSETIRPFIKKALSLGSDERNKVIPTLYFKYPWKNPGEGQSRRKIASIAYFEPWDWLILATAYEDDYVESQQRMASALTQMIEWIAKVAVLVVVLSLLTTYYVTRGIIRPLEQAIKTFEQVGQGQFDLQLDSASRGEIGQLTRSFNQMLVNLKKVTASRDELNQKILELNGAEKALQVSENKYKTLFETSRDAILILNPIGQIIDANSSAKQLFGFQRKMDLISKNTTDLSPEYQPDGALSSIKQEELMAMTMKNGAHLFEWKHKQVSGEEFFADVLATKVKLEERVSVQHTVRDITARKKAELNIEKQKKHLKHLAFYDSLTGLPNRNLFLNRLTRAIVKAEHSGSTIALLLIDLDLFKKVNDTLGHHIGDQLLREVAKRLTSLFGTADTIARLGGDEFSIVLEDASEPKQVERIAQKILDALVEPFCIDSHLCYVSASIGISLNSYRDDNIDSLQKRADVAMYAAKSDGPNTFQFYSPEMDARAHELLLLENDLRRALENEQFVLYYQPQVDLHSGQIVGIEALIRWQHPDRGMIPPDEFIPLAEDTRLIVPIGTWALRKACAYHRTLQEAMTSPLRMSVNISMHQFNSPDFLETVSQILNETGLEPQCLELEVTESIAMANPSETIFRLTALKKMGVRLAIDDFGKGHSSLNHLKYLPIKTLKIDRCFVRNIQTDPYDLAIVETIQTLAKKFDINVIAEGIETQKQAQLLLRIGCNLGQGFLFSRPLPPDDILFFCRSENPFASLFHFQCQPDASPVSPT